MPHRIGLHRSPPHDTGNTRRYGFERSSNRGDEGCTLVWHVQGYGRSHTCTYVRTYGRTYVRPYEFATCVRTCESTRMCIRTNVLADVCSQPPNFFCSSECHVRRRSQANLLLAHVPHPPKRIRVPALRAGFVKRGPPRLLGLLHLLLKDGKTKPALATRSGEPVSKRAGERRRTDPARRTSGFKARARGATETDKGTAPRLGTYGRTSENLIVDEALTYHGRGVGRRGRASHKAPSNNKHARVEPPNPCSYFPGESPADHGSYYQAWPRFRVHLAGLRAGALVRPCGRSYKCGCLRLSALRLEATFARRGSARQAVVHGVKAR